MTYIEKLRMSLQRRRDKFNAWAKNDTVPESLAEELQSDAASIEVALAHLNQVEKFVPDRGNYRYTTRDLSVGDDVLIAPTKHSVRRVTVVALEGKHIGKAEFGYANTDRLDDDKIEELVAADGGYGGVSRVSNVIAILDDE